MTVTETNQPNTLNLRFCFSTQLNRTLNRDTVFNFVLADSTTANSGTDFVFDNPFLRFTAGSSGDLMQCAEITITGDSIVENDESIAYNLIAMSDLDTVLPSETDALTVNIVDDDGECVTTTVY